MYSNRRQKKVTKAGEEGDPRQAAEFIQGKRMNTGIWGEEGVHRKEICIWGGIYK
jgi:hypothetical protein